MPFLGVQPFTHGKFRATFRNVHLGMFDTAEDAARAVDTARLRKLTSPADLKKLNFPGEYPDPSEMRCPQCKTVRPFSDFKARVHLKNTCAACRSEERRLDNDAFLQTHGVSRLVQHKSKSLLNILRSRIHNAKHSRHVFTIAAEHLVDLYHRQHGMCALTGRLMTLDAGKGQIWTAISIDRIDSSQGYVEGNVQLACVGANRAKLNASMEDFVQMCKDVVALHG